MIPERLLNPEESGRPAPGLVAALAEVSAAIGRLEKRGFNQFHKYSYLTASDVSTAVRGELAARGIVLVQEIMLVERADRPRDRGGTESLLQCWWRFKFMSSAGEVLEVPWYSDAIDSGDKGANKAATAARKYFLIATFQIPADDSDGDHGSAPASPTPRRQNSGRPQDSGETERRKALGQLGELARHMGDDTASKIMTRLCVWGMIRDERLPMNKLTLEQLGMAAARYRTEIGSEVPF